MEIYTHEKQPKKETWLVSDFFCPICQGKNVFEDEIKDFDSYWCICTDCKTSLAIRYQKIPKEEDNLEYQRLKQLKASKDKKR
jgi:hypothetical protein